MNLLMIDSATDFEIVSIYKDGVLFDKSSNIGKDHLKLMFVKIESALKEASINAKEIDFIGVGIGPGSFTGIRLAVSAARALAQCIGIPLITAPTPLLYCQSIGQDNTDFIGNIAISAFDAKKGRVFGAAYEISENILDYKKIVAPGDYTMDFLVSQIPQNKKIIAIGNGCEKYLNNIITNNPNTKFISDFQPKPMAIAQYFVALQKKQNYNDALPLYARKSDAEVLLELNKNIS